MDLLGLNLKRENLYILTLGLNINHMLLEDYGVSSNE